MTKEEISAKIEWEGGIAETIMDYGLAPDVLPEDTPLRVRAAWERLYGQAAEDVETIQAWLWVTL